MRSMGSKGQRCRHFLTCSYLATKQSLLALRHPTMSTTSRLGTTPLEHIVHRHPLPSLSLHLTSITGFEQQRKLDISMIAPWYTGPLPSVQRSIGTYNILVIAGVHQRYSVEGAVVETQNEQAGHRSFKDAAARVLKSSSSQASSFGLTPFVLPGWSSVRFIHRMRCCVPLSDFFLFPP
ncbi:hypothetical protein BDY19DRAFT_955306, partial [Irpex rosettiformis]